MKIVRYIFAMLLFVFVLTSGTTYAAEDGVVVTNEAQLRMAVIYREPIVIIDSNIHLSNGGIYVRHDLVLRGSGTITVINQHKHFTVNEGGVLSLDGVTIRSMSGQWNTGVYVYGGIFNMYSGAIIGENTGGTGVAVRNHGVFNMHGGIISGHRGTSLGGSVSVFHGIFNMHGGEISGNGFYSRGGGGQGGGVNVAFATFNMHGGSINNNIAGHGGGIHTSYGTINIHGGEIRDNEAGSGGGIDARDSRINLYDGEIIGNIASEWGGGGISLSSSHGMNYLIMHGGTISGNSANMGGGIDSFMSFVVMYGGTISDNTAGSGGGVSLSPMARFAASGGTISGNTAYFGGGIHVRALGDVRDFNNVAIGPDVVFYGNSAERGRNFGLSAGREQFPQIMWSGENSRPGTHLLNNYDISYDGSWLPSFWQIYLGLAAAVIVLNAILYGKRRRHNRSKKAIVGAALALMLMGAMSQTVHANDIIVVTNEAELRQAVRARDAVVVVDGIFNIDDYIGIIHAITITGSGTITVSGNHRHFGISPAGNLTLEGDVTLTRAEGYDGPGGGIHVSGVMQMNGGNIIGNRWDYSRWYGGGGVHVGHRFIMRGGLIYGNTSLRGGGVYVHGSNFQMRGGTISNNHALTNGGGVYVCSASGRLHPVFTMSGGRIVENSAAAMGGGIFSSLAELRLRNGEISQNTAAGHGGVFAAMDTVITIGPNMRISNNNPVNAHESGQSFFMWFITPDIWRFAVVFALASGGVIYTRHKKQAPTD
jgi:hypothetical protein